MASDKLTLCVCGGGNAAHVMSGLSSAHPGLDVRVLTLYGNEAEVWMQKLEEGDFVIVRRNPDGSKDEIKAKPAFVTKDPQKGVTGADVIAFCVPAFAHKQYLEAIAPYVAENTAIIGLPGQSGFEFQCYNLLKDKAKTCAILNAETLPWACRIAEYGKQVEVLGTKKELIVSKITGKSQCKVDPQVLLQDVLGPQPALRLCNNYMEIILNTGNGIHLALMYGKWNTWDGKPLPQKPLFYQGLTESDAELLTAVSDEILQVVAALQKAWPSLTFTFVESIKGWFMSTYQHTIKDSTSLHTIMRSNSAYEGLVHPMKEVSPGQWEPDFKYRYLSEDVPYAMTVIKGVAQLAGVATPVTDRMLIWAQGHLGKEYMQGSELKGADVKETRAPQAYGFQTLNDLLAIA